MAMLNNQMVLCHVPNKPLPSPGGLKIFVKLARSWDQFLDMFVDKTRNEQC
jgi:hypothetical protein